MSPVPLTSEEWDVIQSNLPNIGKVCDRITNWIPMDDIYDISDKEALSRVRISQICFRDASNALRNTHYALGQAIGVKQYFLNLSQNNRDNNYVLAHIRSRFYADYVPLLLVSSAEHSREGLKELLQLPKNSKWNSVKEFFANKYAKQNFTPRILEYIESENRTKIANYRNDWVHNKPPIIESPLYNLPRNDFIPKNSNILWIAGDVAVEPDYKWDELIELLKQGIVEVAEFLKVCVNLWEDEYAKNKSD